MSRPIKQGIDYFPLNTDFFSDTKVKMIMKSCGSDSIPMPETLADLWAFIEKHADNTVAYLEKVGAMPGQGVASMFKFGQQYGYLQMALTAARIPFFDVTPQKWQKALGLLSRKNETKTGHKRRMKGAAQQYFPDAKVTLKNSDSILIAFYGLQQ